MNVMGLNFGYHGSVTVEVMVLFCLMLLPEERQIKIWHEV